MLSRLKLTLSYANVTATIAVFLALGGGAYAAIRLPANSVGTRQIRSRAVTARKLAPSAIAVLKGQKGDTGSAGSAGPEG